MNPARNFLFILFLLWSSVTAIKGNEYYMDAAEGRDSNAGTSREFAWQTLQKINQTRLYPGDKIFFRSGRVWEGTLILTDQGKPGEEIIIDKYGEGSLPVINGSGNETAILLENPSHVTVQNIEINNTAIPETGLRSGIYILWTGEENIKYENIRLQNLRIQNVDGIISRSESSRAKKPPFWENAAVCIKNRDKSSVVKGLHIENCTLRDVKSVGCSVNFGGSDRMGWIENIIFRNNLIERTGSDALTINKSINVRVENNRCYDAGFHGEGSTTYIAGIWVGGYTHNSVFQYNEVARTRTFSGDGNAFDIDIGVSGTHIFQYNYTHDNEGGPIMVMPGDNTNCKVVFRYNVCVDDYKHPHPQGKPAFWVSTLTIPLLVYNNTFCINGDIPFTVANSPLIQVKNNIFYAPSSSMTKHPPAPNFSNNCFYGNHDVNDPYAINKDPLLINPGPAKDGMENALKYMVSSNSPCRNKGTIIANNGGRDFAGNPIDHKKPDIGAFEYGKSSHFANNQNTEKINEDNLQGEKINHDPHLNNSEIGCDRHNRLYNHKYDSRGKKILSTWYTQDSINNTWMPESQCKYFYDNNGFCTDYHYFDWDTQNNKWIDDHRYEIVFDSDGNPVSWTGYNKEVVSNSWIADWKHEYAYDDDGNWITRINYWSWDALSRNWIPTNKRETSYDENDEWTSSSSENWLAYTDYRWNQSNENWMVTDKAEPSFDNKGRLIMQLNRDWNAESNSWNNNYKHEYFYDTRGNLIRINWYSWETEKGNWKETRRFEYNYDENNNLLSYQNFHKSDNEWIRWNFK